MLILENIPPMQPMQSMQNIQSMQPVQSASNPERKPLSLGQKVALGAGALGLAGLGAAGINHYMNDQEELNNLNQQYTDTVNQHAANNMNRAQTLDAAKNENQSSYIGTGAKLGAGLGMAGMLLAKGNPKIDGALLIGGGLAGTALGAGANALFNRSSD